MNNNINEDKININDVFVIAIPMILATISIPFLGLVDTWVAGHLGNVNYLSATEVGDTLFGFIYMLFSFLRLAVTGLTAQASGKQANEELLTIFIQGLILALFLGFILILAIAVFACGILNFISTDFTIQKLASDYLKIRIFSVPAALGNLVISAFLLGMKHAKFSMYLLILINTTSMILDILLAYFFGMGINGLAYAVVIGQCIGLIFGMRIVLNIMNIKFLNLIYHLSFYIKKRFSKFIHINSNLLIRSLCFIAVYGIFLVSSSRLGTLILAVNSILLMFYSFISFGLEGFANAAEVLIGNAVGKNNYVLFKKSILVSFLCAFLTACGITLVYVFAGHSIVNLVTNIPEVQLLSGRYLIWISILPLICVWCYALDAVFLGMLRIKAMRNSLIIATLIFYIPVWIITQPLGNNGLWLSLISFFIGRILVLVIDLVIKPLAQFSNIYFPIK